MYAGVPPWDIGRPQPEFVRLAEAGKIDGDVLDVGCGTGENALYLAKMGHDVWGIDAATMAVAKARAKARSRGLIATFLVHDALQLPRLNRTFRTIIDSGLFHIFSDEERHRFVQGLAAALRPQGTYFMLCFSKCEPADWGGPRQVTREEIRAVFRPGWRVNYIREARFKTRFHTAGGRAWLASITRLPRRNTRQLGGRALHGDQNVL
jgi:cyclopropane fatty-acyl-phospholipid synthase-like methyltransferase